RIVEKSPRHYSAAKWALSWLYNQKEVTVVLSGMNSVDMVNDNCQTATAMTPGCLTQEDLETIQQIKEAILENEKVGCTGCRYCMPCPQGVDIPGIFRCYNTMYTESKREGRFQFAQTVGLTEKPAFASQCVECGLCEKHCPQMINIREKLKEADKALRPLPYKVGINIVRWYMFHRRKPKSENA
ncbi:MAG: 4Fe-4S dicluster domain-containing protein, partial [Erysipelotrichaceae bacterium]|nr:4Fe-4S dicluster domain-containing protein [Erysipelotrichaceae bacterium]